MSDKRMINGIEEIEYIYKKKAELTQAANERVASAFTDYILMIECLDRRDWLSLMKPVGDQYNVTFIHEAGFPFVKDNETEKIYSRSGYEVIQVSEYNWKYIGLDVAEDE